MGKGKGMESRGHIKERRGKQLVLGRKRLLEPTGILKERNRLVVEAVEVSVGER